MTRAELRTAMGKYVKHPERLENEILDKFCRILDLTPESLETTVVTIDEDIKLWEVIKKQCELIQLMKSTGILL